MVHAIRHEQQGEIALMQYLRGIAAVSAAFRNTLADNFDVVRAFNAPTLSLSSSCVLDKDDPIGGLGNLGQQRIGQRRLAARSPAGNKDVVARCNCFLQSAGLAGGHDPLAT